MGDESGSKGYGFVHFETQEAAEKAINTVNNMLLNGKIVYVGNFLPKHSREVAAEKDRVFTNIFVKNFGESMNEDKLKEMFAKFGEITSVKVATNQDGKPLGFGFVNFKSVDDAARAVAEMNEFQLNDKVKLYVGRFQNKTERLAELRRVYEERKMERLKKYQGVNLFLKNLDDKIDEERLKKEFALFGEITSVKVSAIVKL